MPKIIINEEDHSKAGSQEYSNFAVVVPGFLGTPADGVTTAEVDALFDENGIYECTSQTEFKSKIGLGNRTGELVEVEPGVAPTISRILSFSASAEVEEGKDYVTTVSDVDDQKNIITWIYADEDKFAAAINGYHTKSLELAEGDKTVYGLYVEESINSTGLAGELATTGIIFKSTADGGIEFAVDADETYYIIADADKGRDSRESIVEAIMQYGNQIAYELLGLGYTVLYKKMSTAGGIAELSDPIFWECLKDKSSYDFRYITNGLLTNNSSANDAIKNLAEARQDCIALVDVDATAYTAEGVHTQSAALPGIAAEANKYASKYVAVFAPSVTYNMKPMAEFAGNTTFPAYFHYLACAAYAAANYSEWYAVAGYTRGVCKYSILSTGCKFGDIAVQILEPRFTVEAEYGANKSNVEVAVNLIVKIKNSYYLWGNRTGNKLGTEGNAEDGNLKASHYLNIRQLCTTIKKQLYTACRSLTFDPNSNLLWINFCSLIEPTLKRMKADQGLKDYSIDPVKASEKGTLCARIRIVPIEAVEDFVLDLVLVDSLEGADVQVSE